MLACRPMLAHIAVPLAAEPTLTVFQAFVLGAVQGITELLPISSSAHLFLFPTLLGWPYFGVTFDIALHAGTLLALIVAYLEDWRRMAQDFFADDVHKRSEARSLLGMLAIATVPAAIAGKLLGDLEERLRSVVLIATLQLVFGVLLWAADRFSRPGRDDRVPGWGSAIGVGLAQCLSLVPGVSRSGITMTAGRAFGLTRLASARFSFLLSMPITLAAVMYTLLGKSRELSHAIPVSTLLVGVASSALFGFLAIRFLLGLLRRTGFGVFALYRVFLALGLFAWWAGHR
jgi:undecaprenyl-diphosphatase